MGRVPETPGGDLSYEITVKPLSPHRNLFQGRRIPKDLPQNNPQVFLPYCGLIPPLCCLALKVTKNFQLPISAQIDPSCHHTLICQYSGHQSR